MTEHALQTTAARRRRSYHSMGYRQLMRLPIGVVPEICLPLPLTEFQLRWKKRQWSAGLVTLAAATAMLPMVTYADVIYTTYLAAKAEQATAAQLTAGTTSAIYGTENFSARPLAAVGSAASFTKNFGAGNAIVGTFSGTFGISAADQYGGALNTGRYITTTSPLGFSIKFTHTAAVRGVNYFGLQVSALDNGNELSILRSGVVLQSFTAAALRAALQPCPNVNNPYCGNPTTAANGGEPYAFLSIFDLSGYFDEIKLKQIGGSGGFEADNFTVGFREPNVLFGTTVNVPQPASVFLMLPALAALALALRRRRVSAVCPGAPLAASI